MNCSENSASCIIPHKNKGHRNNKLMLSLQVGVPALGYPNVSLLSINTNCSFPLTLVLDNTNYWKSHHPSEIIPLQIIPLEVMT